MKSSSTRLAAGVLAVAIPLAPTGTHQLEDAASTSNAPIPARISATAAESQRLTTQATTRVNPQDKAALSSAIQSATSAATQTVTALQAARAAAPYEAATVEERLAHAAISLEAAHAEISHALTLLPATRSALRMAFEAMLTDIDLLRREVVPA